MSEKWRLGPLHPLPRLSDPIAHATNLLSREFRMAIALSL